LGGGQKDSSGFKGFGGFKKRLWRVKGFGKKVKSTMVFMGIITTVLARAHTRRRIQREPIGR